MSLVAFKKTDRYFNYIRLKKRCLYKGMLLAMARQLWDIYKDSNGWYAIAGFPDLS